MQTCFHHVNGLTSEGASKHLTKCFLKIRAALVMVSLHSSRIMTKTDVHTRDQVIAATGLIMMFVGGIWKTFRLWTRKLVGHFKLGLRGHPSRNTETVFTEI